jgi:RecB family exonuclease
LSDLKALNPTEWRNIPPPIQNQFNAAKKVLERLIDHCNKLDPDTIATYH